MATAENCVIVDAETSVVKIGVTAFNQLLVGELNSGVSRYCSHKVQVTIHAESEKGFGQGQVASWNRCARQTASMIF